MKKDIEIEVKEVKSVESVSDQDLNSSLINTMRTIQTLSYEYPNDEDFGRNVRKYINGDFIVNEIEYKPKQR